MYYFCGLILLFSSLSFAQISKPTQPVSITNWQVSPLTIAPSSDTGQSALPVRVISQLGAGSGGSISVSNFPAIQSVSFSTPLSVTGNFFQSTQPVSIAQTLSANVLNFPSSFAVNNFPATQPVSGSVSVSNFPASQAVSGSVSVSNFPSSFSVSNFPATQAVSGTVAISGTVPVSGTFWQATQPVSIATMPTTPVTGPLTDTQLRASPVPVSGTVTASISNFPTIQSASLTSMAAASNNPTGVFSLGNSLGKVNVMKTGTLASSATTADQVILTYTVTTGKTFYLTYFACNARLTTFAATATYFGDCSIETPSGTKVVTTMLAGSGIGDRDYLPFTEPVPIASGAVIRVVTTPTAATAMTWRANFGGYEK